MSTSDDRIAPLERPITLLPRPRRERSVSSVNIRSSAMEILSLRLQSISSWERLSDADRRAHFQIVGEAYDHGDRRNEHKRLRLEGELIAANARIAELEGLLAEDRHSRAIASTIPPPGGDGAE